MGAEEVTADLLFVLCKENGEYAISWPPLLITHIYVTEIQMCAACHTHTHTHMHTHSISSGETHWFRECCWSTHVSWIVRGRAL